MKHKIILILTGIIILYLISLGLVILFDLNTIATWEYNETYTNLGIINNTKEINMTEWKDCNFFEIEETNYTICWK